MTLRNFIIAGAGLVVALATYAAVPAAAPAGSTGLCKDGSYTSGVTKKGACKGHKGIQDWYAGAALAAAAATPAAATAAAKPATMAAAPTAMPKAPTAATPQAPGGGAGKVWANSSSKVYHCSNDKWYGKTKAGEYMSEADAKAKGYHVSHGQACPA